MILFRRRTIIRDEITREPYLTRWYLFRSEKLAVYLHHFHSSDQRRDFHDHPWEWAASLILRGGYREERLTRAYHDMIVKDGMYEAPDPDPDAGDIDVRTFRPGDINMLRHGEYHRVDLLDEQRGAWTLFIAGPRVSEWGFIDRITGAWRSWRSNKEAKP